MDEFSVNNLNVLSFRISGTNIVEGSNILLNSFLTLRGVMGSSSAIIPFNEFVVTGTGELLKILPLDLINRVIPLVEQPLNIFGYFAYESGVNVGQPISVNISHFDDINRELVHLATYTIIPNDGDITIGTLSTFSPQLSVGITNEGVTPFDLGSSDVIRIVENEFFPNGFLDCEFFPPSPSENPNDIPNDVLPKLPIFTTRIPCPTTPLVTKDPTTSPPLNTRQVTTTTTTTTITPTTEAPITTPSISTLPIFIPTSTPPDFRCDTPTCNVLNF